MMKNMKETQDTSVEQAKLDPDQLLVRPTYKQFGVYERIADNRARVIYEGSRQACYEKINELRGRMYETSTRDRFSIYQLKDDESLHSIRFESLDRLKKEGQEVKKDNYLLVYEAPLKPGTTLEDLYYQFNMDHPLDFRGHSLSVSDVVILHQDGNDKAFYVDSIGFTELLEFLPEKKTAQSMDAEYHSHAGGVYDNVESSDMTYGGLAV